jgi:hypothetical protein
MHPFCLYLSFHEPVLTPPSVLARIPLELALLRVQVVQRQRRAFR